MMAKAQSMALHQELNSLLRQGQKECLYLNGLIRKLKSGQTMLMMKKDKAKTELAAYVNKMSESLIEFKSEMLITIQDELDAKVKEITSLREKYEAHIRLYMELCNETEKLMQFGKVMVSEADLNKAKELLKEFRHLQEITLEKFELDAVMKLEFYPALPIDCISSSVFGDLIRGTSSKPAQSSLSALSGRKIKSVHDQSTQADLQCDTGSIYREKKDNSTQTDTDNRSSSGGTSSGTKCQERNIASSGYSCTQYANQCLAYPQTSLPGFEYVPLPCQYKSNPTSLNPPPGFSVLQQSSGSTQIYQPTQLQLNASLVTGIPLYTTGPQYGRSYNATDITYPVQNIPLYSCNRPVSPGPSCLYPANQHYGPVVQKSCAIPNSLPGTDSKIYDIPKKTKEKSERDGIKNELEVQQEVRNIPLPVGPAPKENIAESKIKKGPAELRGNNMESVKDSKDLSVLSDVKQEEKCGIENKSAANTERFDKLLQKSTTLLKCSSVNEKNEMWDVVDRDIVWEENESKYEGMEERPAIDKIEKDQMLSNIGHVLKEKISKGETVRSQVTPLRRPLRLPKNVFNDRDHSEAVNSEYNHQVEVKTETYSQIKMDQTQGELETGTELEKFKSENEMVKEEVSERSEDSGVFDFSAPTGVRLRDIVKGQGLSKREISEKNKETLQLQTNWMKGYLKQMLPKSKEKEIKVEVCDENNNATEESVESDTIEVTADECEPAEITTEKLEPDFKESVISETNVGGQGFDYEEKVKSVKIMGTSEAYSSYYRPSEKLLENLKLNSRINKAEMAACENVEEADNIERTSNEQNLIKNETHSSVNPDIRKGKHGNIEEDSKTCTGVDKKSEGNTDPNKSSNVLERKADLKNLKSAVKGFLGDQKEGKHRSCSTYSRLGALQAHWLKHTPGTSIKASFMFQCSHNMHFPIGLTTNSLQHIIVTDTCNHCIKMFDQDGQFIRTFRAQGMHRPSALVVNEFDHIFVKDDISIRVFDNKGDYITEIAKGLSKPFGLVLTPAKCLLVLETDRHHPALVHISQDGNEMWRFPYQPLINSPAGSKCRFMGVSENNVVVSDLGLSKIYITSFEGVFYKVIGSLGTGVTQFTEPSGISVDNYGNIVIGDSRNNRVQVYRHDGSYTGLVQFDEKIIRPSGIHLTSDNKLLVVNYLHHVVKVYKLQA